MNKLLQEEAVAQLRTVKDLIRFGASQFVSAGLFFGHGTDNAWDEAVQLVFHVLNLPLEQGRAIANCRLVKSERQQIIDLLSQRVETRVPGPYLTHHAYFAGLDFYVDERVIIPRSPIAELIEQGFSILGEALDDVSSVLDLCTGGGCIAIAVAKLLPETKIDAVDISADALAVAQINVDKHHVNGQVSLIQSDLFTAIAGRRYDLILCNPPYVDAAEMQALPAEFRHEPELALASGQDGLDCAVKILQQAAEHLTERGILILEVGASMAALQARFPQIPFLWLEFEHGGEGVCLLTRDQLLQ
jgi:ribosomal protein L3 glutamine methyltransferase